MLENWSATELIFAWVLTLVIGSPVVYAWADRWLDRTRNKIADVVTSDKKE